MSNYNHAVIPIPSAQRIRFYYFFEVGHDINPVCGKRNCLVFRLHTISV